MVWLYYELKSRSIKTYWKNLKKVEELLGDKELPRFVITKFKKENGFRENAIGAYNKELNIIFINSLFNSEKSIKDYLDDGYFSTKDILHPYVHEMGHKIYYALIEKLSKKGYNTFSKQLKGFLLSKKHLLFDISEHASNCFHKGEYGEVFAEYICKKYYPMKKYK